ncbi:MAG: hypothetical protein L6308_05925 [Candidatus Omnitrophica bacterium]|nr:hypothetical protein [Candidatus Omnitrophota bacterium]
MDEQLKNRLVVILAVLTAIFFFATLSSCNSAVRQKAARDKEMSARLQLEEKMSKFSSEKSALEEKALAKEKEALEAKQNFETTKKVLLQEQLVNESLKEELQKVTKLKENLENDLKNALAAEKRAKK